VDVRLPAQATLVAASPKLVVQAGGSLRFEGRLTQDQVIEITFR
jgi:hypothetical protein